MTITLGPVPDLPTLLQLDRVKPDAFLGTSPKLGWPRLYGGQVVAQGLRAAAATVDPAHRPHSLHAYFIRAGREDQPVLYEVERLRDGRSFTTRHVVAAQASGPILNLIASFQAEEEGEVTPGAPFPEGVPPPEHVAPEETDLFFEQRPVSSARDPEPVVQVWMRAREPLGDDPVVHACALAYLSDEHPLGVAIGTHSLAGQWEQLMAASLDHALWFHRPLRADDWLLVTLRGAGVANARGLALGRVFAADRRHVASVAQEGLVRARTDAGAV